MEPKFLQTNIWIWKFCRAEGQIVPMRGLRNTAYASWVVKMMKIDFYVSRSLQLFAKKNFGSISYQFGEFKAHFF